jgi:putative ABC transport system permease protein
MTGSTLAHELRMAWRGVRSRGWRAAFAVALLAVAMAVNVTVFSAADAFVFRTVPYAAPETLAVLDALDAGPFGGTSGYVSARVLEAWRSRRDVFAAAHAYAPGQRSHLTTGDVTERLSASQITPGLLETIGVLPAWGRPFVQSDAVEGAPPVVLIGESLARRLFGSPERAIGQTIRGDRSSPTVVGVMPSAFRFPSALETIWWPLDLAAWPDNSGVLNLARLAPGMTLEAADARVRRESPSIAEAVGASTRRGALYLRSLESLRHHPGASTVFAVLLGAAVCLLLIACANVASLETAAIGQRARQLAVQSALGASRGSLVRIGLAEGLCMLVASLAGAALLAWWGVQILERQLTRSMREALANPLDLDLRTLAFMTAVAAGTWLLTTMPAVWRVSRLSVVDGLRDDPRVMPVSRGAARSRQLLMTGQVALTVLLLVGALLYIQTYENRIGLEKGFDAASIAAIQVSPVPSAPLQGADLEAALLDRLRATPGVQAVSRTWSLPPSTQSGSAARPTIDGEEHDAVTMVHFANVDPEYLPTMGIEVVEGSGLVPGNPSEEVVIDERFARRFWASQSPLGSRFRLGGTMSGGDGEFRVVGVSRELRPDRLVFIAYKALSPTSNPLTFVARLADGFSLSALTSLVRATAEQSIVRVESIEERYRALEGDTRLAAAITGGFAVVALLVATCGIYAVMAFLVSGRRREIGIRMALGADRGAVRKLVFGSALRFVLAGTVIGLAAAAVGTQAIAAQLFGVTPIDPATYAGVASLVAATAVVATWWPAHRAAAVDPAVTLRAE